MVTRRCVERRRSWWEPPILVAILLLWSTARYGSVFFAMERIEGWSVSNPPATLETASAGLGAAMGETLSIFSEVQPDIRVWIRIGPRLVLDRQVDRCRAAQLLRKLRRLHRVRDLPHVEAVSLGCERTPRPGSVQVSYMATCT